MKKLWLSNGMQQVVFLGPALLFFSLVIVVPFGLGIYYSFTDWNGVSSTINWVGFSNYVNILTNDSRFGYSLWFTIRYTVVSLVLMNAAGFALAYALTKRLRTRNLLRTAFFIPYVLGGVLLGFIWQFIFVQGFPAIGKATGISFFQLPWLGTEATGFWGLVLVFVWHGAGYLMVIYIAGLMNVPNELKEAATIDGAGPWKVLRHVILPMMMPIITICLFLTISWSFKMFDLNLSLTKGGPFNSTESVAMNIYTEAFASNRYGLGTAKAFIFFVTVAIITALQYRLTSKREVDL